MTDQAPDDRAAGLSAGPSATPIAASAEGGEAQHRNAPEAASPHHPEIAVLAHLYERLKAGLERLLESRAEPGEEWLVKKTEGAIEAFSALAGALAKLIQLERLVAGQPAASGAIQILAEKLAAAQHAMAAAMPQQSADTVAKPADPAA
jgi:hypothetical protein